MFKVILKLPNNVAEFLLDLKFDSIDMFFDSCEMLLFFLLPFEQSFNSFHTYHLPINHSDCFFVSRQFSADFFNSFANFHDIKFVTIVFLFISVCASTLFTE